MRGGALATDNCPLCGSPRVAGAGRCKTCTFAFLEAELGAETLFLRRLAAAAFVLALVAFPLVTLLVVANATPEPGQPEGLLVLGGSFGSGLAIGIVVTVLRGPFWAARSRATARPAFPSARLPASSDLR